MGTKGHSFILACNPSSAALKASEVFHQTPTASSLYFFSFLPSRPPFLKSNFYNPISGPYATAHLGSSREVLVVSIHGAQAVWRQMELYPAGISSSSPCRAGWMPVLGVLRWAGCWRPPSVGLLQETGLHT